MLFSTWLLMTSRAVHEITKSQAGHGLTLTLILTFSYCKFSVLSVALVFVCGVHQHISWGHIRSDLVQSQVQSEATIAALKFIFTNWYKEYHILSYFTLQDSVTFISSAFFMAAKGTGSWKVLSSDLQFFFVSHAT